MRDWKPRPLSVNVMNYALLENTRGVGAGHRILCKFLIENVIVSGEDWAKIWNYGGLKWEFMKKQVWDGKSEILHIIATVQRVFIFEKSIKRGW